MIAAPAPGEDPLNESTPETANLPGHANTGTPNTYHTGDDNQGTWLAENITALTGPAVLIPIPKGQKGPKLQGWQKLTLEDMTPEHHAGLAGGNVGILLGEASEHLVSIDADSDEFLEAFLASNPELRESLLTKGRRGGNVWLRMYGKYPRTSKIKTADGAPWGEWRAEGAQTVIMGTHPVTGQPYTNNGQRVYPPLHFMAIKWPANLRLPWVEVASAPVLAVTPARTSGTGANLVERARAYVDKMPPAIQGQGGSDAAFNVAKKLVHDFNLSQGEALPIMEEYNARCSPPWSVKELVHKLEDAAKCSRSTTGRGELVEANRPDYRAQQHYEVATVQSVDPIDNDVPAPMLADDALYGIAGDIVRKIAPVTEAHPASLLLQLLAGVGSIIGRGPHFMTGKDRQHCNLFVAIVGDSSRGRKGTSWGWVHHLLEQADPAWTRTRIKSGLQSGEGIIHELKDGEEGVAMDKRLFIMEGELAQALQTMSRSSSTLSATLRNAWDSGFLNNMSKGDPATASNCHISLVGHITRTELRQLLTANDAGNGFANRILWGHSARTQKLPEGGDVELHEEGETLWGIVDKAKRLGAISRTTAASDYWSSIYGELTNEDVPGLWGKATSRAEAQVVRLSLLYCLLDITPTNKPHHVQIGAVHLKAAKALWDYCFHSARWALEECRLSKEAQKILEALAGGSKDRTYLHSTVFSKNLTNRRLDMAINEIEDQITVEKQQTDGRTRTIYILKTPTT